jgi:hypothetical protein
MPSLFDCVKITNLEYLSLVNPQFVGQTRANHKGEYYMVWLSEGVHYSTFNQL